MSATIILFLLLFLIGAIALGQTQGHFVYALDDAYIHMAMAKNFSGAGVWGVTTEGFTSTSSSPLWTLLLAGIYALVGVNSTAPLVMNLLAACLLLGAARALLVEFQSPPLAQFATLCALILLTPLPALVFGGMEHTLHAALALVTSRFIARATASQKPNQNRNAMLGLMILAPLLTAIRPEGVFMVAVISIILFRAGMVRWGMMVGFASSVPVVSYGIVSILNGWSFLPTSVLLKSAFSRSESLAALGLELWHRGLVNLWEGSHLVLLMSVAFLADHVIPPGMEVNSQGAKNLTRLFLGTSALHLAFARPGWFFRYEAYLVALGIVIIAARIQPMLRALEVMNDSPHSLRSRILRVTSPLLLILTSFVCLARGINAATQTPQAMVNAFEQQYQMASFIGRYYPHEAIALNDIGSVNFYAEIRCVDLFGLATPEVAQLRMQRRYRTGDIDRITSQRGVRIALVYDMWYKEAGGLPVEWTRVGQWQIRNNVVNGSDTVSIYAVNSQEIAPLQAHLADFAAQLPPSVLQSGLYLDKVPRRP